MWVARAATGAWDARGIFLAVAWSGSCVGFGRDSDLAGIQRGFNPAVKRALAGRLQLLRSGSGDWAHSGVTPASQPIARSAQ